MARMDPLPPAPELAATFDTFRRILGIVPNSLLTMQRRPRIVAAFETLAEAVDGSRRRSRAAGCQYCQRIRWSPPA